MSDTGAPARRLALEVLARVEDDDAYSNLALSAALDRSSLDTADRGFVTDLVYGTLRRRRACDHLVGRFLTSEPPPAARRALRLGAYQLTYRDDIPAYAAVAATVEAAPKRFRGLTNAILRKVSTTPPAFPDEATRLSYPDWVLDRLTADLGHDRALGALEAMNEPAKPTVRDDGYVQDLASQWVVDAVDAHDGELIVDLCAAPGGKATGMAAAGAVIIAADRAEQRVDLVRDNARRVGAATLSALVADGLATPFRPGSVDKVLLDAPCSGLGVLRRRPDARWRIDASAPDRLAELQRGLVDSAVALLRPGATLIYSVCTLTAAESIGIDEHIRTEHPSLTPLEPPASPWEPLGRGAVLLPQTRGTDGMCLFRYRYDP